MRSTPNGTCIAAKREAELDATIAEEQLRPDETPGFVDTAFGGSVIRATGTDYTTELPPVSRFCADGGHGEKKQRVIAKASAFFERSFAPSSNGEC